MSVIADFQCSGQFPAAVGGTGITVKYFPRILGPSIGVAPVTPSATSPVGMLVVPGQNVLNGQNFIVRAVGTFGNDSGDPSGTVKVALYAVTGTLAVPVYTQLSTIATTVPLVPGVGNWMIVTSLYGDSSSGLVGGNYTPFVNGVLGTAATTTSVLTGINFNTGNPGFGGVGGVGAGTPFGLVIGVTFGTSDATNKASLTQFQIQSE